MSISTVGRSFLAVLPLAFLLSACGGPLDPEDVTGLSFDARAEIIRDTVHFFLDVENLAADTTRLTGPGCPPPARLLVYEGSTVRWDERRWPVTCTGHRVTFHLPPAHATEISRIRAVADILGDSLPDGTYRLIVAPHFDRDLHPELGGLQFPVGDFVLGR